MSHPNKLVTVDAVYLCTGKPSPATLDRIYKSLLDKSYAENVERNSQI